MHKMVAWAFHNGLDVALRRGITARTAQLPVALMHGRQAWCSANGPSSPSEWERDVLRLERAVLQQSNSRYEVQGEYTIPPTATIPRTAASLALAAPATASAASGLGLAAPTQPSPAETDWNIASGRWRVQVCHNLNPKPVYGSRTPEHLPPMKTHPKVIGPGRPVNRSWLAGSRTPVHAGVLPSIMCATQGRHLTTVAAVCRQVNVPEAHMEEILPAARLLSQATAVTPSDYEHAKAVFLRHVQSAGAAAENLSKQAWKKRKMKKKGQKLCWALCLLRAVSRRIGQATPHDASWAVRQGRLCAQQSSGLAAPAVPASAADPGLDPLAPLQVEELTKALAYPELGEDEVADGAEKGSKPAGKGSLPSSAAGGASGGGRGGLRGLQDVRGEWQGAVQVSAGAYHDRVTAAWRQACWTGVSQGHWWASCVV